MTTTKSNFNRLSNVETFPSLPQWQPAVWEDYVAVRDDLAIDWSRIYFHRDRLLVDMGKEGINHAKFSDLLTMIFFIWFSHFTGQSAESLGRCLIEKPNTQGASPDLVLYIGEGVPYWQPGEPRRIELTRWRVPDLVGEISDTTLADDLDDKKQLYADLGIPEYWVVNVLSVEVIAFRLQADGKYRQCSESVALRGLPIALLEQTLQRLKTETNITVAGWFAEQLNSLSK
jgi:Uma2 family endonuclease